ncbi:MAG: glutaredoxin family protein [Candidatus Aenigmarchaeota archaeon]|nr:glutaredoxin family protein [Candidatus Aenigmarchaeota archaeon]
MSVTVYSTNTCPYCDMAKKWLKDHDVTFVEKNVQEDDDAAEEMISKSGQTGVPVLDINGEILVGYNPNKMKQLLKK